MIEMDENTRNARKTRKIRKPARRYHIGNAQSIGKMEIQSNYFAASVTPDFASAAVADGGIDHINGRTAAVIAVEKMMAALSGGILSREHFLEITEGAAKNIIRAVKDYMYRGRTPSLSLSAICISEGAAYYYIVGDVRIYVYNDRNIRDINGLGPGGVYHVKSGDNFMLVSRGGYEALAPVEMLQFLRGEEKKYGRSGEGAYYKAVGLVGEADRKNMNHAGNTTVVLLEGVD